MSRNSTASAFSNHRRLSLEEIQLVQLTVNSVPNDCEPNEIRKARDQVIVTFRTAYHLNGSGQIPIIDSFDYQVLQLKGKIK